MAKIKVKRKSTFIDMTAMSDVTVLLLTFFMLTSTFVKKEPIQVSTPGSVSELKVEEKDLLTILVDPTGKIFMSLDNQTNVAEILRNIEEEYNVTPRLSEEDVKAFSILPTFGVALKDIHELVNLPSDKQDEFLRDKGIPIDTTANNQFRSWIKQTRKVVGKDLQIAIKADQTTPYPQIKNVINTLVELRENKFNLITSLKKTAE